MIGAVLLGGCVGSLDRPQDIAFVPLPKGETPPVVIGQCWASDVTPAVIETVTEQVQTRPERRDSTGNIIRPAEFQTKTAQNLVQDRQTVWFRAPCRGDMTVAFIASLQRALKARGRFPNAVTGVYDSPTAEAVRKLQAERGLDSAVLSLDAARDLGLAARDFANQ